MGVFDHVLRKIGVLMVIAIVVGGVEAQEKAPVPDAEAQKSIRQVAGEIYGDRFREAKTPPEKSALAKEILQAALKMQNGTPDQYVLIDIARSIAVGAGDVNTALNIVEALTQRFDLPADKMKNETLLSVGRQASTPAQYEAIIAIAGNTIEELTAQDDYAMAISLCETARSAALKMKRQDLAKKYTERIQNLKKQEVVFNRYREAVTTLEKEPVNPAANLTAGRYLCFVKGEWGQGLPKLAAGDDAQLSTIAARDLAQPTTSEKRAALGDDWWTLAENQSEEEEKKAMMLRAALWYQRAMPELTGVGRLKVKKRLEELARKLESPVPLAIAPFDTAKAKQYRDAWAEYLKTPVVFTNSIDMKFILIPAGEFMMGSPVGETKRYSDERQHQVRITRAFYLGIYEVTQEQYGRVMGTNPSEIKGASLPVENVSWIDAMTFCRQLSTLEKRQYRLPTEAEWEYACRAGTTTAYYNGNDPEGLAKVGNVADGTARERFTDWDGIRAKDGNVFTAPVGQYRANSFGLYDMYGNVSEWCIDWYDKNYYSNSPANDPKGPSTGSLHVFRGGAWNYFPWSCRSAFRGKKEPEYQDNNFGFRVVLVPAEDDHPAKPDTDHHPQPPEVINLSPVKLQEAYDACETMKWNPQSADDYAKIAEYAIQVWGAFEDGVSEETTAAAKESVEQLSKNPLVWAGANINTIDKLAAEALSKEGASGGCFFYGRFLAVGPPIPDFPGVQPVVMRLSGTEQYILVLVAKNADQLDREKHYLIVGRILPSRARFELGGKEVEAVFVQAISPLPSPPN